MSNSRQSADSTLIRTFGVTFNRTQIVPPVSEEWDQFVYASKGVLTLSAAPGVWVVPPHRGIWLPAQTRSRLEVTGQTALRMIYVHASAYRLTESSFDRSTYRVLNVSPLLRELILRAVKLGALSESVPSHRPIAALILDELRQAGTLPLQLPAPVSEAAQTFAAALRVRDGGEGEVARAIRQSGASRRTLERMFRDETGMSLGQWIRRRRLLEGLRLLAEGETSAETAFRLGYSTPSAFIAMFRRELGASPGEYLRLSPGLPV